MKSREARGKVYLVGAGPGDPDLLTVKALRLLETSDVVVFDYLVNPVLLKHVRPDAERIFIGKPRDAKRISQVEVEQILVDRARAGRTVVRLKGGDPFIFGRGGEEAESLAAENIHWEVVPGVSAGHAVPAYAGIPLTHRDLASSVAFVTGHESADKNFAVDWNSFAAIETLVIFMGLKNLPHIVGELVEAGRAPETPVAVVQSGTHVDQKVVTGSLANISTLVKKHDLKSPALTIVGDVVQLREKLRWFPPDNTEDETLWQAEIANEILSTLS